MVLRGSRSASVRRATKRQWCRPISVRSEHKQSWQTAGRGTANLPATVVSGRRSPSSLRRRSCRRRQRHCSGGWSWALGQQACWSARLHSGRCVGRGIRVVNVGRQVHAMCGVYSVKPETLKHGKGHHSRKVGSLTPVPQGFTVRE